MLFAKIGARPGGRPVPAQWPTRRPMSAAGHGSGAFALAGHADWPDTPARGSGDRPPGQHVSGRMRFGEHKPQGRHHPRVGKRTQCAAFRFPYLDIYFDVKAKKVADDAVFARDIAHLAPVTIDQHGHSSRSVAACRPRVRR
jgi:hypothetical protein